MPPAPTGVADYAAALKRALDRCGEFEGETSLYQIGNNPLHADIYRLAMERPGYVLLHDAVLHHFLLGHLDEKAYHDEFVFNYGEANRQTARELWRDRSRSGADVRYFEYPMLRRLLEASLGAIVHNEAARRMVLAHRPNARVTVVPHLYEPVATPVAAANPKCLFGVFGHLRESKRIATVLRAWRALGDTADLLIAGDFVSPGLEQALDLTGVIRVPYASPAEFERLMHSVDVCVNLRFPAAGETSGMTIRMMGAGKPVIVSDIEENRDYPAGTHVAVDTDGRERAMLEAMMLWLARDREAREGIGRRAQAHILAHHRPEDAARQILEFVRG